MITTLPFINKETKVNGFGIHKVWWGKTKAAVERLLQEGKIYVVNGEFFYEGRPIIHRDSGIDGGVYLGESEREAIVVDIENSPLLQRIYEKAKDKSSIRNYFW